VLEKSSYFEGAKYITINNCREVTLESTDFHLPKLEQLCLHHIHIVVFNAFLPSSLTSLQIEDVNNLTSLPRHIFIHTQHLHNLVIKNTNVQLIEDHTFTDLFVKNVLFINTTFKYLTSNSLNFTGMEDSLHNSVFRIERCTFEKLDLNAISVRRMNTFQISESEFKGILKKSTFKVSTTTTLLHYNVFTCSKEDDTCDDIKLGILENLYEFTQNYSQDMCKLLQTNYCNFHRKKSLILSLQNCYPKLLKYGISKPCIPLEPDRGHNIYNIHSVCLSLVCMFVQKVMLL